MGHTTKYTHYLIDEYGLMVLRTQIVSNRCGPSHLKTARDLVASVATPPGYRRGRLEVQLDLYADYWTALIEDVEVAPALSIPQG